MAYITLVGFKQSRSDSSLFIMHSAAGTAFLLLYVDDMVLSASTPELLQNIITKLRSAFSIKDMGPLNYFLSINVKGSSDGFFLSQVNYVEELLERAGMANCKQWRS
jgi:hypothetical protein